MEGGDRPRETADGGGDTSAVMRWESFLPRRSLRVLLVESDDSTRHVVTALLRKCSYCVAGVADGMKAWEVMKEKKYIFDLVLTEVAMPSLSGIGLLTRIMGAEECKNIPVIMMSSHDSVNVVLNCMLKGAVDFLVKPVRKNELRNLWQHVWRRHCSNSFMNASENTTASNHISTNVGGGSKSDEDNDERCDAQSSGSKRDEESESIQTRDKPPHTEDRHADNAETNPPSDKVEIERSSMPKIDDDHPEPSQECSIVKVSEQNRPCNISSYREVNIDLMRSTDETHDNPKSYCQNNTVQNMVFFVEPRSNGQCSFAVLNNDGPENDNLCKTAKSSFANDASNIAASQVLELSLRRPQSDGYAKIELEERRVLKPSVASAFSRYGGRRIQSSDICSRTTERVDNFTSNEKSTAITYADKKLASPQRNGAETTVYFQVSSSKNENSSLPSQTIEKNDTTLHCPQFGFIPIPIGTLPYHSLCHGYGTIVQPLFFQDNTLASQIQAQIPSGQALDILELGDSRKLCNINEKAYNSGSCSQEFVTGETEDIRNVGICLESANECEQKSDRSRREAALLKFRLKRKDRCFEKKVRYHSRKKLAEQRTRIKGQFVQQKVTEVRTTAEAEN